LTNREQEAQELREAIEKYIADGGTITVCEPFARTDDLNINAKGKRIWGRKKSTNTTTAKKATGKKAAK
jgi:hypothetical protein